MKPFHRLFRFKTEINIDMNIYTSLAHCHDVYTKPAEKFRYPINVMILKRGKAARENSVSNTVSPGKSSSKIVIKSTARSITKLLTLIMFSQSLMLFYIHGDLRIILRAFQLSGTATLTLSSVRSLFNVSLRPQRPYGHCGVGYLLQ